MSGGVKDVLFEDIKMKGTQCGIRIKSARGRGGTVERITYKDIDMDSVGTAIQVTMLYVQGLKPTNATATPIFRDIVLQNVRALDSHYAFDIHGLEESPIQNPTLSNVFVDASYEGTCEAALLNCVDSMCPRCCGCPQVAHLVMSLSVCILVGIVLLLVVVWYRYHRSGNVKFVNIAA